MWFWWLARHWDARMKVRVQLPPSIDAEMDVVAPDPREDLIVYVQSGDGARYEMTCRWTNVDIQTGAKVAVAKLWSITPVGPARIPMIETVTARALPAGS